MNVWAAVVKVIHLNVATLPRISSAAKKQNKQSTIPQ